MRYNLTPVRMVIIKKIKDNKSSRECRKKATLFVAILVNSPYGKKYRRCSKN
jgi:hypothetical protein